MVKKAKQIPKSSSDKDDLFLKFTNYICNEFIDNFIPDITTDREMDEDYFDGYCMMMNTLTLLAKYLIWDSDFDIESEDYQNYLEDFANAVGYCMELEYGYSESTEEYLLEYVGEYVYEFCDRIKKGKE